MMRSFVKGLGVGMVIGATAGMMVSPKTRKKMMKSKPVKAIMSIGEAVEDLLP
ncbi:MAG: hypothetical protein ACOX1Q_04015 [Eubacteriales bacterium]|jgi:gas vesicle protein